MGDWVCRRIARTLAVGGQVLWQRVLLTEWGGMNDALFRLFEFTRNTAHLAAARAFNAWVFTAPLAVGEDTLADLPFPHANFHLPEVVGNARAYELSGNVTDAAVVNHFLEIISQNHSYATGGSSSGECWQPARDLGRYLDAQTEESCTQYNVLKVARRRFLWRADAADADFYETALWNGILGNQKRLGGRQGVSEPSDSSVANSDVADSRVGASAGNEGTGITAYIYMLPLGGVQRKPWGDSAHGFPCCWGTLSESFAKLGDSIYFRSVSASGTVVVYVNQFAPSTVTLAPGVALEQTPQFPVHPTLTATLQMRIEQIELGAEGVGVRFDGGHTFELRVRVPGWLQAGRGAVMLNGRPTDVPPRPGSYVGLNRTWIDGDEVTLMFPPSLHAAPLNDVRPEYNGTIAFMWGPLVLAGLGRTSDVWVPSTGDPMRPERFIRRTSSDSADRVEFEAMGADGEVMRMIPLRDVVDEEYVVYFMTAGEGCSQLGLYHGRESSSNLAPSRPVLIPPRARVLSLPSPVLTRP